jgi:hypothetical protein
MQMDERWCPADPVAKSPTVLQSNLQQSTTDGEGGRAAKALAERRGSSGFGGARAPNNKNLGWLKDFSWPEPEEVSGPTKEIEKEWRWDSQILIE